MSYENIVSFPATPEEVRVAFQKNQYEKIYECKQGAVWRLDSPELRTEVTVFYVDDKKPLVTFYVARQERHAT